MDSGVLRAVDNRMISASSLFVSLGNFLLDRVMHLLSHISAYYLYPLEFKMSHYPRLCKADGAQ